MSKVILFGIDGGSLKLIEQWKDELPNFKEIVERGVFGELESTVPAFTCPAWPCMFTGKNPGKLGMYDFFNLQFTEEHGPSVFSSSDYHTSSLWTILNDYGKEVGLFNVPITYPPHKINGFMVCGIGTPIKASTNYTYPAELKKTLDEVVDGYEVFPPVILTLGGQEKKYLETYREALNKKVKAARYLIRNFPWDLFVSVFSVSDAVQHYFWHHMDADHPKHIDNSKYKDVIKDFYKRIDEAIGILKDEVREDVTILIASDHGFNARYGDFSMNKWLEENGLLKFHGEVYRKRKDAGLFKVRDFLMAHMSVKLVRLSSRIIPKGFAKRLSVGVPARHFLETISNVDWSQTKAYSFGATGGIFVNLKGRQPSGIVGPGREYENVRDEIVEKLSKVVNPKTGEPANFRIYRREEIHHGKYADFAPDISIVADKYYPATVKTEPLWGETVVSGSHARQGMFMAYGPDIRKEGLRLAGLKIYDVAPTILHILDVPVLKDMDGRVMTEIFELESEPARRPVVYREVSERQRIKETISQLKASGKI